MTRNTNAARLLDQIAVQYELLEYEVNSENLSAETVAAKMGLQSGQLFKTLVAQGDRHGFCMATVPGDEEWNLKAPAAASGDRKVQLVPVKDLQKRTGYVRGGVTALARKHTQSMLSKASSGSIGFLFPREFVECRFSSPLQTT